MPHSARAAHSLAHVRSRPAPHLPQSLACPPKLPPKLERAKAGGEGRTRTFEAARATDLQSAAFDRFATSPIILLFGMRCFRHLPAERTSEKMELAKGLEPPTC